MSDAEEQTKNKKSSPYEHLQHLFKMGWSIDSSQVKFLLNKYPELLDKVEEDETR